MLGTPMFFQCELDVVIVGPYVLSVQFRKISRSDMVHLLSYGLLLFQGQSDYLHPLTYTT
jgi:hypothetical protein